MRFTTRKLLVTSAAVAIATAFIVGYLAGNVETVNEQKYYDSPNETFILEINEDADPGKYDMTIHTMQRYVKQDEETLDLIVKGGNNKEYLK